MTTEYLDWTSLTDEQEGAVAISRADDPVAEASGRSLDDLLEMDDVPEELKQLVKQQHQLERQMDQLTGKQTPTDWNNVRFSMPEHSPASRLADKQRYRKQEDNRLRQRQSVNRHALNRLKLERGLKAAELARREKLLHKRLQQKQTERRIEHLELQKQNALRDKAQQRVLDLKRDQRVALLRRQQIAQSAVSSVMERRAELRREQQNRTRQEQIMLEKKRAQQQWLDDRNNQNSHQDRNQKALDEMLVVAGRAEKLRQQRIARLAAQRMLLRRAERRKQDELEHKRFHG